MYDKTHKYITPKKELYLQAEKELNEKLANLKSKEDELAKITAKLELVYKQLWAKQFESEQLQKKIDKAKIRLDRAEKLRNGLGGEQARWTDKIAELTFKFDSIVGDILLSAATITYLGE